MTAPAAPPPPHPNMRVQQLVEQQIQEELRKNAKRAANRRSASTCRARKKVTAGMSSMVSCPDASSTDSELCCNDTLGFTGGFLHVAVRRTVLVQP